MLKYYETSSLQWVLGQYLLVLKVKHSDFYFGVVFLQPFSEVCVYSMAFSLFFLFIHSIPVPCGLKLQSYPNRSFWSGKLGSVESSWKSPWSRLYELLELEQVAETCGCRWNLCIRTFQSLQPGAASASVDRGLKSSRTCLLINDENTIKVLWRWKRVAVA